MTTWIRKKQEQPGTYFFSGTFFITKGVCDELTTYGILFIYRYILNLVAKERGLDYLQVFVEENGAKRKLYFIDQLSKEMIDSGHYDEDDNYCTLMWSHEY